MPGTPQEMIQQFCSVLPKRLTSAALDDYGLELNPSAIQRITQEILSLCLFWMEQAFRVTIPKELSDYLLEGIAQTVLDKWRTDYDLDPDKRDLFFQAMEQQHVNWERISKQGGEPIVVLSESISGLEAEGIIGSENHQKLLALFLDWVPIDEVGEIAGAIEEDLAG